jgi:hypothetical protein
VNFEHATGQAARPLIVQLLSQRGAEGFTGLASRLPGGTLDQGDIVFTTESVDKPDVVIVQNYLKYDRRVTARSGYIWKWDNEPIVRRPFAKGLDRVYTHANADNDDRVITAPPVLDWWVERSYDELSTLALPKKPHDISAIASTKVAIEGHRRRAEFVNLLEQEFPDIQVFGQGRPRELRDKWDGLAPFRYSVAIENTSKADYWSEKIADCFLTYTVPFYFGATNISQYFPEDSYICLPVDNPETALATIRDTLANDDWESRLPALKEARRRVLNNYSFGAQIIGRIRSERAEILSSPFLTRVVHGRRTKPRGWVRGAGLAGNLRAQIERVRRRRAG